MLVKYTNQCQGCDNFFKQKLSVPKDKTSTINNSFNIKDFLNFQTPKGSTKVSAVSFFNNVTVKTPIVNFPGFSEGDNLELDGPMWYNGDGKIKTLNDKVIDINISMKVPSSIDQFVIKDGKINISMKLEKQDDGKIKFTTTDHNDKDKSYVETGTIKEKEINGKKKQYIIKTDSQTVTLTEIQSGKFKIEMSSMPGSIEVIKK